MGIKAKKESATGNRKIEFRLEEPNAREVCLVGDFNGWDIKAHPMRKNEKGVWSKTITVAPGRYEYRFYADGQWLNDPNNPLKCENCFGTENNVLVVLPRRNSRVSCSRKRQNSINDSKSERRTWKEDQTNDAS